MTTIISYTTYQFYFLKEIWVYSITNQIYLITLLMVFSLVTYLFIRARNREDFELTTSEQYTYLKAMSENAVTADLILDIDHNIKFANSKLLQDFGISGQEIDGIHIKESRLPEEIRGLILSEHEGKHRLTSGKLGDKTEMLIKPITNDDGRQTGKLAKIYNSSDLLRMEIAQDEGAAHNLKSSLNAIIAYGELLSVKHLQNREAKSHLSRLLEESELVKNQIEYLITDTEADGVFTKEIEHGEYPIKTILIVDDVAINRTLLQIILIRNGYQILEAKNGKEALNILEKREVDLVLMDLSMPVMNGIEATEQIRARKLGLPALPVIAVTASSKYNRISQLEESGFNGLLKKPFQEEQLINIVKESESINRFKERE